MFLAVESLIIVSRVSESSHFHLLSLLEQERNCVVFSVCVAGAQKGSREGGEGKEIPAQETQIPRNAINCFWTNVCYPVHFRQFSFSQSKICGMPLKNSSRFIQTVSFLLFSFFWNQINIQSIISIFGTPVFLSCSRLHFASHQIPAKSFPNLLLPFHSTLCFKKNNKNLCYLCLFLKNSC